MGREGKRGGKKVGVSGDFAELSKWGKRRKVEPRRSSSEDTPRRKLLSRDLQNSDKNRLPKGGPDVSARPILLPSRSSLLPAVTMSLKVVFSSTLGARTQAVNNLNGGSFQQDALCTRKGRSLSFDPRSILASLLPRTLSLSFLRDATTSTERAHLNYLPLTGPSSI